MKTIQKPFKLVIVHRELPLDYDFVSLPQYGITAIINEVNRTCRLCSGEDIYEFMGVTATEKTMEQLMSCLLTMVRDIGYVIRLEVREGVLLQSTVLYPGEDSKGEGEYLYYDDICSV